MRWEYAMFIIACAGCQSVHKSSLPPYVRDLRVSADRIDMIQCGWTYTKTTTHNPFGRSDTDYDLEDGPCWRTPIPTAVAEQPMVPGPPMQGAPAMPTAPAMPSAPAVPTAPTAPTVPGGRR